MYSLNKLVVFGDNVRCKQVVLTTTFLLMTFNMVTDWFNWKQWSVLGGYNEYEFFHIFSTAFLVVAAVGTILWALKTVVIVAKFPSVPHKDKEDDTVELEENNDAQKNETTKETNCLEVLNILLLIVSGLFEDFPALLLIFYASALPGCGTPTRYESGSAVTITTVMSSMLNSLWTMILLFCGLFGYCGCNDAHVPMINMSAKMGLDITRIFSCRKTLASTEKLLLCGFIFLLFTGNFSVGLMALGHIAGSISFVPSGSYPVSLSHSVPTGIVGPGLDAKPDGAMFVYLRMKLPDHYYITIYDKNNNSIARSMQTNELLNRLYIGQFKELSHLKDGTLVKAIPCSRIIPMQKKIDASAFIGLAPKDNVDFSKCKIILRMKYETDKKWNHFRKLNHDVLKSLKIDWGINIKNIDVCPFGVKPLHVDEFLTDQVQNDIVKYQCSSACGNDTDICDYMDYGKFHGKPSGNKRGVTLAGLFLAINDMRNPDSCFLPTEFKLSFEFCDESWSDVEPVEVPTTIQDTYPQFITLPTFYQWNEGHLAAIPQNYCDMLWNQNISCCRTETRSPSRSTRFHNSSVSSIFTHIFT